MELKKEFKQVLDPNPTGWKDRRILQEKIDRKLREIAIRELQKDGVVKK